MGCPSMTTHRGLVHWQVLLLVVSLLNFWSQPTTAQMRVRSTYVIEGENATLHIHNKPHNAERFLWFRGNVIDSYSNIAYLSVNSGNYVRHPPGGQVTVNNDGSLLLKNVTVKDSGAYTLMVQLQGCQKLISCGRLNVYQHMEVPTLLASSTTVTENKDSVVLSCSTSHDIIEWLYEGRNLMLADRMKLSIDRRNLTIDPVLRWDAGIYECKASYERAASISDPLKLDVKFD